VSMIQLRAFHFVALAGGFSRAAREMAVSQSSLSAQVRQLETKSGLSLFERKPLGVALTPDGHVLFDVTKRLFAAEAEARAILRSRRQGGGHLRVAADAAFHSVQILARLKSSRPDLTFTLSIGNSGHVIEQLVNHRADVGITARRPPDPQLHVRPILSMRIGIFVPAGHEWSGRGEIATAELAGRTIVLREKGSVTRETFESTLADHQVAPGSMIEVSSREAVCEVVAAGLGIGIIADREIGHDSRLCFLPLTDSDRTVDEYAVCFIERCRMPIVRDFLTSVSSLSRAS
jgi:aminoethylphosphonate catabolism LysR family transcriptional regulator